MRSSDSPGAPATTPRPWARRFRTSRTSAHVITALVLWPLATAVSAAVALTWMPYFAPPVGQALAAALGGVAISYGDLFFAGAPCFTLSWLIFRSLGRDDGDGRPGRLWLEPVATFAAVILGASLWYPALLSQPLLYPVSGAPVAVVLLLLGLGVGLAASVLGRLGRRVRLGVVLLLLGACAPLPLQARALLAQGGHPAALVILGVDSVSHADDLRSVEQWVDARQGAWYTRAVAPGLLTNAVWSSILAERPVSGHSVFHIFQQLPVADASLLAAARGAGYRTVSMFPDQLTCAVGSRAGFDEDRSGPVGWRQILLPLVANSSVLLPLVRSVLPEAWPSPLRANQAGTYTYDVRRDIRAMLRAGTPEQRSLVMAHLTYTHSPAYPSTATLSWAELRRLARAPAMLLQDHSLDWQHMEGPDDPLPLRRWKIEHLFQTLAAEVESAGFLEAGGQLVVFSDHGQRFGLTPHSFQDPQYHHVLLATLGLPARCPRVPISLIDIGRLTGLREQRAEPAVEFAIAQSDIWPRLVNSSRLRWRGDIELDQTLLAQLFGELRRHTPWPDAAPCEDTAAEDRVSAARTKDSADRPGGTWRR